MTSVDSKIKKHESFALIGKQGSGRKTALKSAAELHGLFFNVFYREPSIYSPNSLNVLVGPNKNTQKRLAKEGFWVFVLDSIKQVGKGITYIVFKPMTLTKYRREFGEQPYTTNLYKANYYKKYGNFCEIKKKEETYNYASAVTAVLKGKTGTSSRFVLRTAVYNSLHDLEGASFVDSIYCDKFFKEKIILGNSRRNPPIRWIKK